MSSSDGQPNRRFLPSLLADNPHLAADEYTQSLLHLPPVQRERLLHGDWDVREAGLIKPEWLRYYVELPAECGPMVPIGQAVRESVALQCTSDRDGRTTLDLLDPAGRSLVQVNSATCRRFITVDPAGTSADRARERRGRAASHTVAQVWDQPRRELSHLLILRHQERGLLGFDELLKMLERLDDTWHPERIWIENEKLGQAAEDIGRRTNLPIDLVPTRGRDKATRQPTDRQALARRDFPAATGNYLATRLRARAAGLERDRRRAHRPDRRGRLCGDHCRHGRPGNRRDGAHHVGWVEP